MTTQNIISTPKITGNVGSCTSQGITTVSGRTSWSKVEITNTVTNSCTGEVKTFQTWEYTATFGMACLVSTILLVIVIIAVFATVND